MKSRRRFVLITAWTGAFVFLNRAWGADPVSGATAHASSAGLGPGFEVVIDSSGSSLHGVPVALVVGGGVPDLTQEIVLALGGAQD